MRLRSPKPSHPLNKFVMPPPPYPSPSNHLHFGGGNQQLSTGHQLTINCQQMAVKIGAVLKGEEKRKKRVRNANRNECSRGRSLLHGHGTFGLGVGGWWGLAVGSRRLVAVGGWRLAVGGWRLAVLEGCPSPKKKKMWVLKESRWVKYPRSRVACGDYGATDANAESLSFASSGGYASGRQVRTSHSMPEHEGATESSLKDTNRPQILNGSSRRSTQVLRKSFSCPKPILYNCRASTRRAPCSHNPNARSTSARWTAFQDQGIV